MRLFPAAPSARLAVFALRAALRDDKPSAEIRFQLDTRRQSLSFDEAASWLASVPKPVGLDGTREGSLIHVQAERAPSVSTRDWQGEGNLPAGWFPFLTADEVGPDATVVCWDGDAVLRVTLDDFDEWRRSYVMTCAWGMGADRAHGLYPDAQGAGNVDLSGAVAFVSFGGGGTNRLERSRPDPTSPLTTDARSRGRDSKRRPH